MILFCLFMSWTSELVATGVIPNNIAVDSSGNPYILVNGAPHNLILFSKNSGTWVADTFEDFADNADGINGDIVVDCFDRIWVVYRIYSDELTHDSNYIVVACKDSGIWTKDTVHSGSCSNFFQSIATDSKGNPHVTYDFYLGDPHWLEYAFYAYFNGNCWIEEVFDTLVLNYACSIDMDANDYPHIVYQRREPPGLDYVHHATKLNNEWLIEKIDEGDPWLMSSIRIGPDNLPNIVYNGWGGVRYAYTNNNAWHTELIDAGSTYFQKSIDTDSTGRPYIVYGHNYKTWLTYRVGDSDWHKELLPESNIWDAEGSIRIAKNGGIHISRISWLSGGVREIYYIHGNVGVEEVKHELLIPVKVYPNPFRESITLDFDGSHNVIVYDIAGRIVKDFGVTNKLEWHTNGLSSGVYFCRIGSSVIKIVKN